MKILAPSPAAISEAVEALKQGALVAFPTETVYGLGASAVDANALKRLYAAKGRPAEHPVIVHLADTDQLSDWVLHIPPAAMRLAQSLWPGPMTLILPRSVRAQDAVTGGQNSVGVRIPNHPVALELLKSFGDGVAAPSANKFGQLSPTNATDVASEFRDELAIVLDGGPCDVGIESTIIDFSQEQPRILRPGMILPEQIELIAGIKLQAGLWASSKTESTRVPGGLPSHYAPNTPLEIVSGEKLEESVRSRLESGKRVCVLSFRQPERSAVWVAASNTANVYARQLYSNLRKLDQQRADVILVEAVPTGSDWDGISDRLRRAASKIANPKDGQHDK